MCIIITDYNPKQEGPITAYKIVRKCDHRSYCSPIAPRYRVAQNFKYVGENLFYEIGKPTNSPSGPGIYCYANKKDCYYANYKRNSLLEITIPENCLLLVGHVPNKSSRKVYVASQIIPVSEFQYLN